ncbi:MAG: type II and III secretion system protein family protein [Deltaproteobacteria bacterium]|nr:type II and III secretion system protein family protein [Deltaproteobacteria bacterium]
MSRESLRVALAALVTLGAVVLFCGTLEAAELSRRTIELRVGAAHVLSTAHPVRRVSVAAPEIADVVVVSPTELYTYGKKAGSTSVILWEEGNGQRTLLEVVVAPDLGSLKEKLYRLFPDEQVEVHASENGVVLSGTVSAPEVVDQVLRVARTYLRQPAQAAGPAREGGEGAGDGITNLMRVGGLQQVMLEVKFAEVTRGSEKDWQAGLGFLNVGKSFTGTVGTSPVFSPVTAKDFPARLVDGTSGIIEELDTHALIQRPGSLLVNIAATTANVFVNIKNFTAALRLLESEGLARVLAEPRLVTQSGQEARFLAGGEFPIPVATGFGQISIEFKEFGVALAFTPIVMSDGRISLRVAPSVSEIASTSVIPAGIVGANFVVPNLATRKLETTVQLYDGQTLALAGLLQDSLRENVSKIPGLGNLPVLGALFRSTSYTQQKTDLLVAVTPHLVKPVRAGSLSFPGDGFQPPSWYEFYLEGKLEGASVALEPKPISPAASPRSRPGSKPGGLEGEFGHKPVL